jgi:hypothetical protein
MGVNPAAFVTDAEQSIIAKEKNISLFQGGVLKSWFFWPVIVDFLFHIFLY